MAGFDPISAALDVGGKIIDRVWPDPAQAAQAKLQLLDLAQKGDLAELTAQAGIVQTEAASSNWITAAWRPITMLTFTALIVARWLGYSAPGISEAEILKLWDIVQLGLGGYVIGRSAEKVLPQVAEALKR